MEEEYIVKIPLSVFKAGTSLRDYFDRVAFHSSTALSEKEAWERTEEELARYFPCPRYSSYESFRVGRSEYVRGLRRGGEPESGVWFWEW